MDFVFHSACRFHSDRVGVLSFSFINTLRNGWATRFDVLLTDCGTEEVLWPWAVSLVLALSLKCSSSVGLRPVVLGSFTVSWTLVLGGTPQEYLCHWFMEDPVRLADVTPWGFIYSSLVLQLLRQSCWWPCDGLSGRNARSTFRSKLLGLWA